MKTILSVIIPVFCFSFIPGTAQEIKTFWGDKKYMVPTEIPVNHAQNISSYILSENAPDGYYVIYHHPNLKVKKMEGQWEKGKKEGTWIYYSEDGKIARTVSFLHGMPHGEELYYNTKNNEIILKYSYVGGIKQGEYFLKYANGKLWETGFFKNGLPDGEWKYWDYEGKLIRKRIFRNGRLLEQINY